MKLDLNIQKVRSCSDDIIEQAGKYNEEVDNLFEKLRDIPKEKGMYPNGIWSGKAATNYANARWNEKDDYNKHGNNYIEIASALNDYMDDLESYFKSEFPDLDEVLYDVYFDYDKYKEILSDDIASIKSYLNDARANANNMNIPYDFYYYRTLSSYKDTNGNDSIISQAKNKLGEGGDLVESANTKLSIYKNSYTTRVNKVVKNGIPLKSSVREIIKS